MQNQALLCFKKLFNYEIKREFNDESIYVYMGAMISSFKTAELNISFTKALCEDKDSLYNIPLICSNYGLFEDSYFFCEYWFYVHNRENQISSDPKYLELIKKYPRSNFN